MKSTFIEFESKIKENKLKFNNKKFMKVFQKFNIYLIIDEEDFLTEINTIKNQLKLIAIDYSNIDGNYFILCFDRKIIIIHQSKLQQFQTYFLNNLDSQFFFLNEAEILFDKQISFRYQKVNINEENFNEEISSFTQGIDIVTKLKSIYDFWSLFNKCLFAFLIRKSYQKNSYNHTTYYLQNKNIFTENKTFSQGDFIKLRYVDSGSSSYIFLIYHIESEEILIKKKFYLDNTIKRNIFQREVQNYLELSDYFPYFPRFFGFNENEKYLIIEYIEGEKLNNCVNDLNFNEKIKILFEIMISIQYLHNKNYVYRDLKPNNVIISQNKIAIVIDFDRMLQYFEGINEDNNITKDFSIYSAPEVDSGYIYYESDVYSIGMLISFMFKEELKNQSKYGKLLDICSRCKLNDQKKRPNLSELINFIYNHFFWPFQIKNIFEIGRNEDIEKLSETKTLQSNHNNLPDLYCISLTEYDNPISQLKMGFLRYDGSKLSTDYMKAFHYFYLSSKQNVKEAHHNIGIMYYYGKYIKRDVIKAINHLEKASNQNFVLSQYNLYLIYMNDQSVQNINKSIHYLQLAADNNYAAAQNIMGDYYRCGDYHVQNINKAIEYYMKAANQDYSEALFSLGLMYFDGNYILRDVNTAIGYFSRAAELNNVNSQLNLAHIFYKGKFVKRDVNKAIYYYSLAAEQNNENAQIILGEFYLKGQVVDYDIDKSIYYYTKAAKQNNANAQHYLGLIHLTDRFNKKDINKAIEYFEQASTQCHSIAQLYLGEIYRNSKFGVQNIQKAFYYFKLSAHQRNPHAYLMLGLLYKNVKNYKESFNNFMVAVNNNIREALFEMGNFYYEGIYCPKDINKALNYYKKAADQNLIDSQLQLAKIYHYSYNIPRDINKAIYYYELASTASEASFHLSVIYLNGKFISPNIEKGINYLKYAADKQYPPACFNLGSFYYYGDYVKKDINKAMYYLRIAADQKQPESLFLLAKIYREGIYVNKNITKVINYLERASYLDYSEAQYYLGSIYLEGKLIERNVKKAIEFLELSSLNGNNRANFLLGSIYYEGIEIEKDINKTIKYYIMASNMNNQFAKNNLGIIYKGNKIINAIELFEEAISKKNDKVSMLNLAKIYFYDETIVYGKYKNNWIDLLIRSSSQNYLESKVFLCVVLIKIIDSINIINIELEIQKYSNESLKLASELFEIIKSNQMEQEENYSFYFEFYKYNDFRYFTENMIITGVFKGNFNQINKIPNINQKFYEGFGFDLFNPKSNFI